MTKREAINKLIEHAAANCTGVGCGIRTLPSPEEKQKVAEAILKVWPNKYYSPDFLSWRLPEPKT